MNTTRIVVLAVAIACVGLSCSQNPEAPREATDDDLLQIWMQAAEQPEMDLATASTVAQQLIQRNPDNINLFFDVLADQSTAPRAKLQAMLCLLPMLTPDMAPRLVELTSSDHETTTRTCATHMLASLNAPAAQARLQELKNDDNARVRMTAKLALLIAMDASVVEEVEALWNDPETTSADKDQMVLVLIGHDAERFLPLYEQAVTDTSLDVQPRLRAVEYLGRKGGASAAEALRRLLDDPATEAGLRQLAESALAAIEARLNQPATTAPETGIDATGAALETAPALEGAADPGAGPGA